MSVTANAASRCGSSMIACAERVSSEIEITDSALFGQLVPPQPGTAEIQTRSGQAVTVAMFVGVRVAVAM